MIKVRTPLRISLGGGGTDLPAYYEKFGGYVLASGINKYITIVVQKTDSGEIIYEGLQKERVAEASLLHHDLTREALNLVGIEKGIKITSYCDVPPGTGLGSSGAYTVGLLMALHAFKGDDIPRQELAREACYVEIDLLRKSAGKQDQYMAVWGGITELNINKEGDVQARSLSLKAEAEDALCRNLLTFYTNTQRDSETILKEQSGLLRQDAGVVTESMHRIKEIGLEIKDALEQGNITRVGILFDRHWKIKKQISQSMSSRRFDAIYELGKRRGALGGKIGGAGGGGFFIFYVEKNHNQFIKDMEALGLLYMDFSFDKEGVVVLES